MRLTAEQLAARRLGIGSSDIASILGVSPYRDSGPMSVFAEKVGAYLDLDEETSEAQELGHMIEPVLIKLYESRTGLHTFGGGGMVYHHAHPWAFATIDTKIIGLSAVVECKLVGAGMAKGWDLYDDGGVPHHVRAQAAWQMGCGGYDECHVAALIMGTRFRVWKLQRDRELEDRLFALGERFWRMVEARQPPPLDESDACKAYLEARYPSPPEDVGIVGHEPEDAIVRARIEASAAEKRAATDKKRLDNMLREHLGQHGASMMVTDAGKVTWRVRKDGKRPIMVFPNAASLDAPAVQAPETEEAMF